MLQGSSLPSCRKTTYQKDSTPLRRLVDAWAEDLGKCFSPGLEIRSGGSVRTWRIATIGLKADWPALSKLGCLNRHYLRESYPFGHGLCHCCMANTRGCETWHEHDFDSAEWVRSMATAVDPWKPRDESGLTRMIPMEMDKKPLFYMIDLFHTFHKGVGADLAGSGLVLFLHNNIIWLANLKTVKTPTSPPF